MEENIEFASKRSGGAVSSSAFDQVVNHCIALALEEQKETYSSPLETFEVFADKFRKTLSEHLHTFKARFEHGYQLLIDEIKSTLEPGQTLEPFRINFDKFVEINTFDKLTEFLAEGKLVYQLFGFSSQELVAFYNAAHKMVEAKRYKDGYDAYSFLVTIAPNFREAWLNLGFTCCQLDDSVAGIEAYLNALAIDPTKADSYLACRDAYIKLQNHERAEQVCQLGIEYALKHKDEPWAQGFKAQLESSLQQ